MHGHVHVKRSGYVDLTSPSSADKRTAVSARQYATPRVHQLEDRRNICLPLSILFPVSHEQSRLREGQADVHGGFGMWFMRACVCVIM